MKRLLCLIIAAALAGIPYLPARAAQQTTPQPPAGQSGKPANPPGQQKPPAHPEFTLPVPGEPQPVTAISFGGTELIKAFNGSADRVRLVMVFSPT